MSGVEFSTDVPLLSILLLGPQFFLVILSFSLIGLVGRLTSACLIFGSLMEIALNVNFLALTSLSSPSGTTMEMDPASPLGGFLEAQEYIYPLGVMGYFALVMGITGVVIELRRQLQRAR